MYKFTCNRLFMKQLSNSMQSDVGHRNVPFTFSQYLLGAICLSHNRNMTVWSSRAHRAIRK